jgi:pyruvate formate lyase activating enzyme
VSRGLIGAIGRYALHDGPGIRTVVFLKGCSLHCPWCHNPEFIAAGKEIAVHGQRCIGCGECRQVCPENALRVDNQVHLDRTCCTVCGQCTICCPTRTLEMVGQEYSPRELVQLLLRDRHFYAVSGGGVTLSGGEPTAQMSFSGQVLCWLQDENIHTAMETNGLFSWESFAALCLPHLDLIFYDLKIADPVRHHTVTGAGNVTILANLCRLLARTPDRVIVRIPLIPGYTADPDNLTALAGLLRSLGVGRCSLLPYHPHGLTKAEITGRSRDRSLPPQSMSRQTLDKWRQYFSGMEILDP